MERLTLNSFLLTVITDRLPLPSPAKFRLAQEKGQMIGYDVAYQTFFYVTG